MVGKTTQRKLFKTWLIDATMSHNEWNCRGDQNR